jgi:hypothetical protein
VEYFNAGIPQDAEAAAAGTLTTRFTFPRGPGSERGLGLSKEQVDDIADFIENGLYDPAFVHFDPKSTTDTFELNARDTTYSKYRPDLVAAGNTDGHPMIDGLPVSGKPQNNDDALSRRDMGLEFLNVTSKVEIRLIDSNSIGSSQQEDVYQITNNSSSVVDTHLLVIAKGLPEQIQMKNASGKTANGEPYRRVFLADGVLRPGEHIVERLVFKRKPHDPPVSYTLTLLSGQGNP